MQWDRIRTAPKHRFVFGYAPGEGVNIIAVDIDNRIIDDFGLISNKEYTDWAYLVRPQQPIETVPFNELIFAYSTDYHKGPGKEKQGIMQVYLDSNILQFKDLCNGLCIGILVIGLTFNRLFKELLCQIKI